MESPKTAWDVLAAYQDIRPQLPAATFRQSTKAFPDLAPLMDQYDVFLFDAFGVLNVGNTPIPCAATRLQALRKTGKRVLMVSNAASLPTAHLIEKYQKMGLGFTSDTLVCSRDVLLSHWHAFASGRVGLMASDDDDLSDLPTPHHRLLDRLAAYEQADTFVLLGSSDWTPSRQGLLEKALLHRDRPVWVANPDLVAPREHGFSREPGLFAKALHRTTGCSLTYFGKPHAAIFNLALRKAGYQGPPERVLMVGDTLHTDILGGRAMGFDTALVTSQGASHGLDLLEAVQKTGIRPDHRMPTI